MIGFAVEERCPSCRMILGVLSIPPDVTAFHSVRCHSRRCRKDATGELMFMIRDGTARVLTAEERRRIVEGDRTALTRP